MRKAQRISWFDKVLANPGVVLSTQQLRDMFEIPQTTYIKDTWLYEHGFIEKIEHNTWRIRRVY